MSKTRVLYYTSVFLVILLILLFCELVNFLFLVKKKMVINTSVSTYKHRLNSINLNKIQNIYSHNTCETCFKYFKSTYLFKYL